MENESQKIKFKCKTKTKPIKNTAQLEYKLEKLKKHILKNRSTEDNIYFLFMNEPTCKFQREDLTK